MQIAVYAAHNPCGELALGYKVACILGDWIYEALEAKEW